VFSRDLLGALTTIETYLVGSLVAVGDPTLAASIERRQRVLAVSEALHEAVPAAVDGVLRASIVAGQGVVDALLPLNLGNLVTVLVGGTQAVLGSFRRRRPGHRGCDRLRAERDRDGIRGRARRRCNGIQRERCPQDSDGRGWPVTRTVDARGSGAAEETQKSGDDQTERTLTRKTPDAKASKDELPAKDSTPPAADKTDQGTTNWPQPYTEKKGDDSPKHEGKKVAKRWDL
jgi:hypothetical protein